MRNISATSKNHIILFLRLLFSTFLIIKAVQRDLIYKNDYTGDLRNRIVGARLINDGQSPYYYKWRTKDGIRYYDPAATTAGRISNITATPFFHELLIPISSLPQSKISDLWFCIEYFMFVVIAIIAISFCNSYKSKFLVLAVPLAFLYTDAWKHHIAAGQIYLAIPFFTALFTFVLFRSTRTFHFFVCGVIACVLVLIRPNIIYFFLPFLLLLKIMKRKSIVAALLPFCIAFLWMVSNNFQQSLWKQYLAFIKETIQAHQNAENSEVLSKGAPKYDEWEGISWHSVNKFASDMGISPHSENGNFFVLYKLVFHHKINITVLFIIANALIIILFFFFYRRAKNKGEYQNHLPVLIITGCCLYMISDLFSPIYRHQYYTVQWFFAVLLFFSLHKNKNERIYQILTLTGVILNMINVGFLKMEHSMGEYVILSSLMMYSLAYYKRESI